LIFLFLFLDEKKSLKMEKEKGRVPYNFVILINWLNYRLSSPIRPSLFSFSYHCPSIKKYVFFFSTTLSRKREEGVRQVANSVAFRINIDQHRICISFNPGISQTLTKVERLEWLFWNRAAKSSLKREELLFADDLASLFQYSHSHGN
jgi:hypothetical protein